MNPFILTASILAALAVGAAFLYRARKLNLQNGPVRLMANIAEGTHEYGELTYYSDTTLTERFLVVKRGTSATRIAICNAADVPLGTCSDEAAAVGDPVNVQVFGPIPHTIRLVASAAIAQDALLEPAASGRVATLGVGAGTHYVIGRALEPASAAGDVIEVAPLFFLRVI